MGEEVRCRTDRAAVGKLLSRLTSHLSTSCFLDRSVASPLYNLSTIPLASNTAGAQCKQSRLIDRLSYWLVEDFARATHYER